MSDLPGLDAPPCPGRDAPPGAVEQWCRARGWRWIMGIDEAGRGPLAGPVTAAALVLDLEAQDAWWSALHDSKQVVEGERERLVERIEASGAAWCVVQLAAAEVDRRNIRGATLEAMRRAWSGAGARSGHPCAAVLVDGRDRVPGVVGVQLPLVRGDARSHAVAGASLLAKVHRDRVMRTFEAAWPGYGFAGHKGYPTASHREAIARLGPCPAHRRSFRLLPGA